MYTVRLSTQFSSPTHWWRQRWYMDINSKKNGQRGENTPFICVHLQFMTYLLLPDLLLQHWFNWILMSPSTLHSLHCFCFYQMQTCTIWASTHGGLYIYTSIIHNSLSDGSSFALNIEYHIFTRCIFLPLFSFQSNKVLAVMWLTYQQIVLPVMWYKDFCDKIQCPASGDQCVKSMCERQ